jgi:hypothetical protein
MKAKPLAVALFLLFFTVSASAGGFFTNGNNVYLKGYYCTNYYYTCNDFELSFNPEPTYKCLNYSYSYWNNGLKCQLYFLVNNMAYNTTAVLSQSGLNSIINTFQTSRNILLLTDLNKTLKSLLVNGVIGVAFILFFVGFTVL